MRDSSFARSLVSPPRSLNLAVRFLIGALCLLCALQSARAAAPLAGTSITNRAEVRFRDGASNLPVRIETNAVTAIVSAIEGIDLTADSQRRVAPGATVNLPHRLTNSGNTPTTYRLRVTNNSGDAFDLIDVRLYRDINGNGRFDSGEPEFTATDTIALDAGETADFVISGQVPPTVSPDRSASITLSAVSTSDGRVTDSNMDTLTAIQGVAVTISKSVTPSNAKQGENLDYTLLVQSQGSTAPASYAVTVNGNARRLIVVRDTVPANTSFVQWLESPADGVRLYHLNGTPEDSYLSSPPSELNRVDAIALGLPDWGTVGRSVQMRFRTRVNDNASGIITNIARVRYGDPNGSGATVTADAISNATAVPLAEQPPTIGFFGGPTYNVPATQTAIDTPLFVQGNAAACNQDPTRVERSTITIASRDTGDSEVVVAIETGPNTGLFRLQTPLPTRDKSKSTLAPNDGILTTAPRDLLTATIASCDNNSVSAAIDVTPFGVVFDARTNAPVSGARVTIIDVTGVTNGGRRGEAAIVTGPDGRPQPAIVVSGSDGTFRFPALPPGTYRVAVEAPNGYTFPSQIPPSLISPDRIIEPNGSYGRDFTIASGGGALAFDVPLDGAAPGGLFLEKEASTRIVEVGDFLEYRIRVRNNSGSGLQQVTLSDRLPRGFSYVRGSAKIGASDGDARQYKSLADPEGGAGPLLAFALGDLKVDDQATLIYRVRVGAGSTLNERATNSVQATATSPFGSVTSNNATAEVRIVSGVLTTRGVIIGKVFIDANRNRIQDDGEIGIPGVRIILEDGTYAVTDSEGKYSLYGLAARTHVVKLDTTTMPGGSILEALTQRHAGNGSSTFAELKAAELYKANFAIIDAAPEVLKEVAKRRLVAERAGDEANGLVNNQLAIEGARETLSPDRRGLASSGTVQTASRGTTLSSAPGGTLAAPAPSGTSDLDNTSLFNGINTPGASAVTSSNGVAETGQRRNAGRPVAPNGGGPIVATQVTENAPQVLAQAPAPTTETQTATSGDLNAQDTPQVPAPAATAPIAATENNTGTSAIENVPQVLAAPNGGGIELSTGTLDGDNGAVITNGGELVRRQSQEQIPEGANEQPIREPIGANNSNLPVAPVRIAPKVNFDELMPTLTPEAGFLDLRDGDTLANSQVTLRIKGSNAGALGLSVNGKVVNKERIGTRSVLESKGVAAFEYVGVQLNPGPNELLVEQFDNFGNVRSSQKITVIAPGKLGALRVSLPKQAYADGRSLTQVEVQVVDDRGTPVSSRTALTLETSLGAWQVIDNNPVEAGVQVFVEGGRATFPLLAPLEPGDSTVRVTSGALGATAHLAFVPELRPLLGAGLIEGRVGSFKVKDAKVAGGNAFDEQLRSFSGGDSGDAQGRAAMYFKGRIQGKNLLTLRYDTQSDTENERLFRDIQPDEFYPVYGDSSLKGFDAQSTSRLYVRVDRDRSYVLYGDYSTSSQTLARSLGEYQRSLTGGKTHIENEKFSFNAFAAHDNTRQIVEEIPAQGLSGPYRLSNFGLVRQSERVEIIVRDRNQPSVILQITPQTRFSDYTLDGLTDGILFRAPIPSRDANLNPIFIRVTYEVEQGGPRFFVGGLDGQVKLGKNFSLGASVSTDRNQEDPFDLRALNAIYRISPNTLIIAEAASTDRKSVGSGNAQRFELLHEGSRLQARLFAGRASENFSNPSSVLTQGREELAATAAYRLSATSQLRAEALRTKDTQRGGTRQGVQLSYERALSDALRLELGIRNTKEDFSQNTPNADVTPVNFTSLRARLTGQVPSVRDLSVFTEYERALSGDGQALSVGGQYQLGNRTRLYAVHELISSLEGRYALNDFQTHNSTLFGIDTDYMKNGRLFSEYRIRDAIDGRQAEAALGLRNLWNLGRGVRLGTSFERVTDFSNRARPQQWLVAK